ncbi:MAG TPA: DUF4261 domain-containing protein [Pirellulaceae bacterium]|nr:DUF4261 domain-containing protein [Pirellulaceae bacterium]
MVGLSMIMTTGTAPISAAEVAALLASKWPDVPPATAVEQSDDTLSLGLGEGFAIIARVAAPIPWTELEGPCATSLLWKNAAEEVRRHTHHWLVTLMGVEEPIAQATLLTQVTAAATAACPDAIGVYWGNATLVVPKPIFVDFAEKILPQGPPLLIWVDFRVGKDSETSCAGFTQGMQALGHMELETQKAPEPPGELRERLMSLAAYVIEHGPIIRDGDTIGEDADEKIRVVFSPSAYGSEGRVMRLVYESASPAKPWWKLW